MQNPSWLKTLWQRLFVIVQLMSYGIISMAGWYQKRLEMSTSQLSCKLLSTHTLLFAWTRPMKSFEPFGTHQVPMSTNTHLPTYLTTIITIIHYTHLHSHISHFFIPPPNIFLSSCPLLFHTHAFCYLISISSIPISHTSHADTHQAIPLNPLLSLSLFIPIFYTLQLPPSFLHLIYLWNHYTHKISLPFLSHSI